MFKDLLQNSKWMAISAIICAALATMIAYFQIHILEWLLMPLMILGVLLWLFSVIWFLWGWLKNANVTGNERRGISASSYILAFLPLSYIFLMATDESRTRIKVLVKNESLEIHSLKIYSSGTIFLTHDTLRMASLPRGQEISFTAKAATAPHMKGEILLEGVLNNQKLKRRIAGPFSIQPLRLKQDWKVVLDDAFLQNSNLNME